MGVPAFIARCATALALGAASVAAQAQAWPAKSITWVVPFTPGGITDSTARTVARKMSEDLGQQIVIDNRGGAGGMVGTEYVAKSPPDGYTILYGTQGTMAANLSLYKNVRYGVKDFIPVHPMMETGNVIVVNASRPYKTLEELVDFAKKNPGKLNMGSPGAGTASHLTGELFQTVADVKFTHVPYKGSAPALADLLAGQIDIIFDYPVSSLPHIKTGKLRPLFVNGSKRISQLPDVRTAAEAGYPAATSSAWSGIFVPAKTPPEVVARLAKAAAVSMSTPEMAKYAEDNGSTIMNLPGPAFGEFITSEGKRWAEVIRKSGASAE
jgi:tripartite-type tricarboxylate transporter receptor subunit TctC